ncbi:MlaE family ABC transporter permease [Paludibaculum fermentans]|uniref:ABC transporter permease n=1 Tax=Paludibaculum fermentans TaxID=1473598 RepID=A0A7S7NM53_PALFE|nr:ABC transporter permease [Paludibaculum fermentans]QOY86186.1 ABC transporter permease [Paludibaculum fermentans]
MLEFLKAPVLTFQEFVQLSARASRGIVRKPYYWDDVFTQMDLIGVGSLPVVILTGFFSGAVMALQMSRALQTYGATSQVGMIVAITLVREMGPVLTALMVAGRNSSGMASELGSMKVTEQIDAMRALGTDPVMKLVKPRLIATAVVLPLLTVLADFVGLVGGYIVACVMLPLTTGAQYWNTAWRALGYDDIGQGLLKPFIFAIVLSLVGCFYGMRTTGGTQGVGRATTQAVVVASVWVVVLTFIIGRIFVSM